MTKVRLGVLSTANIGINLVIPAMQRGENCMVTGIASRNIDNARNCADKLGIKKAYGSYQELLDDPDIDAVYIPLPNHLHVQWSVKALQAGKHVLCEKPIGLNVKDARILLEESKKHPGLKVMEAFMYRHHPRWQNVRQLIRDGEIGQLRMIHSFFSYNNTDSGNIRNQADIGGGGLMDIGCYCISVARFLFEQEPLSVKGTTDVDSKFGTDRIASGVLEFSSGTSVFSCSTQTHPQQYVRIYGSEGYMVIDGNAFTPGPDDSAPVHIYKENSVRSIEFTPCNHYTLQADNFAKSILYNSDVPTPLEDAISNMTVIDKILESAENSI